MPEDVLPQSGGAAIAETPPPGNGGERPGGRTATRTELSSALREAFNAPASTTPVNDAPAPARAAEAPAQANAVVEAPSDEVAAPEGEQEENKATTPATPENISPEEAARREAQSWKDKAYEAQNKLKAIEFERQKAQVQQLTAQQQQELGYLQNTLAQQENLYASLYEQLQEAEQEGDDEAARRLYNQAATAYQAKETQRQLIAGKAQQYQQQYNGIRNAERDRAVDGILAKRNQSLEALQKFNPQMKRDDYFSVLETSLDYATQQVKDTEAKYKKEIAELEPKLRQKWQDSSPGARPDGGGSGGSGSANGGDIPNKAGNARAQIAQGLRQALGNSPGKR